MQISPEHIAFKILRQLLQLESRINEQSATALI